VYWPEIYLTILTSNKQKMTDLILSSLYFILPAYLANMAPVICAKLKLPFGNPINTKLFGKNKTYRGFYSGYLFALAVLALQFYLARQGMLENYSILDYNNINLFFYAFLFGIGAITGDTLKSFFKRRLNKRPGSAWPPFDQLDFIIATYLFFLPVWAIPTNIFITLLIVTPLLHLLTNLSAYKLGLKKVWW
jgi:CDP-2,3-bis-(O-geranylgeranyl)-sn-glycerol synthase